MRETQMAKLRDPFSPELAYHARCFLVQWKEALKGLHSVLVLAHINEDTVLQAVEEAQAISACNDFQQRQPTLDDSIETHEERAERCGAPSRFQCGVQCFHLGTAWGAMLLAALSANKSKSVITGGGSMRWCGCGPTALKVPPAGRRNGRELLRNSSRNRS
jgi:hypothetical protein